ncbi:MAG: ferredoxin [Armatimonadota bacterium]
MITQRIEGLKYQMQQLSGQIQMLQQSVESLKAYVGNEREESAGGPSGGGEAAAGAQVAEKATELQVQIIQQRCRGCGICAGIAPNTFAISPWSGTAKVINPPGDPRASIQMAASRCPTGAIRYET